MNKLWLCAMAVMVVNGCVCTRPCEKNSDCDNGGVCSAYHFCVTPTDGGSDGGQVGPGDGGKVDAGRDSGVVEPTCPSPCAPWESCEDSASGPLCRLLKVSFERPADGDVFDAGETVQFVIRARTTDGGETGKYVPLTSSYGSSQMAVAGNNTPVTLPTDAGSMFTFTAGWANASHAAISISARYCAVQCQPWEECIASPSGGACTSANLRVTWVTPAEGLSTNAPTVAGSVVVTRADGGAFAVTSVPVKGPTDTVLTPNGGGYGGTLTLSGERDQAFTAGWNVDGGAIAVRHVTHDTLPPVVTVTAIARPSTMADGETGFAGYWKKDEKPLVRVTVDGARAPVLNDLSNAFSGAITKISNASCAPCDSTCGCFEVDVAKAPLDAIRGQLAIAVGVFTDEAGNSSVAQSVNVNVTRFKWSRPLGVAAAGVLPVAVSEQGNVVGVAVDGVPNRVSAFAQSGHSLWSAIDAGTVTSAPTAGTDDVFIAVRVGANSWFQPVSVTSGQLAAGECILANSTSFTGDIGVASVVIGAGGIGEAPIGIRNAELRVGDGTCNARILTGQSGRPALAIQEEGGGIVDVFSTGDALLGPNLWRSQLQNKSWLPGSSMTFSSLVAALRPINGLFLDGTLAGGTGNDGIFTVNAAGALSTSSMTVQAASPAASAPAVGVGYVVFGDTSGQLNKVTYTSSGVFGAPVAVGATTGESVAAPIIGASGLIYALGNKGSLAVRKSSDLSAAWSTTSLVTSVTSTGHPALDVYRDNTGAKVCDKGLGVLYFSTWDGSATNLIAVLVDSNGLEPSAPWPKYQRDNGNTGNFSRSLSHWTCP